MSALVIERLKFKGAFGYGPQEIDLRLKDAGKVLISGNIGAGKSSILKLLQFMLYGYYENTIGTKMRIGSLVNRVTKDYAATLVFSVDGERYQVQHAKKGNGPLKVRVFKGAGKEKTEVSFKKSAGAQKMVTAMIGIPENVYKAGIYMSQLSSPKVLVGTPSDRSAFLSSLFGFDIFDLVMPVIDRKLEAIEEEREPLLVKCGRMDSIEERLASFSKGSVETYKSSLGEISHMYNKAIVRIEELEEEQRELESMLSEMRARRDALKEFETYCADYKVKDSHLQRKTRDRLKHAADELERKSWELQEQLKRRRRLVVKERQLSKKLWNFRVRDSRTALMELHKAREEALAKKLRYGNRVEELEAKAEAIDAGEIPQCESCGKACPHCSKKIDPGKAAAQLKKLVEKIDAARDKRDEAKDALRDAEKQIAQLETKFATYEEAKKIRKEISQIKVRGVSKKVRSEAKRAVRKYRRAAKAARLKREIPKEITKDSPKVLKEKIETARKKRARQNKRVQKLIRDQAEIENKLQEYEELRRELLGFGDSKKALEEANEKRKIYKVLKKACSLNGVKREALRTADAEVSRRVTDSMSRFSDLNISTDGDGKLKVDRDGRVDGLGIEDLSGGQIITIASAAMAAFASILPRTCNLRMFDEPGSSLNQETYERLLGSLDQLSAGCESILFVSNVESGLHRSVFDQIWHIEVDENGFNTIKVEKT